MQITWNPYDVAAFGRDLRRVVSHFMTDGRYFRHEEKGQATIVRVGHNSGRIEQLFLYELPNEIAAHFDIRRRDGAPIPTPASLARGVYQVLLTRLPTFESEPKPEPINLIGKRFGKLVVDKQHEANSKGQSRFLCRCDCGEWQVARARTLVHGRTTMCDACAGR